MFGKPLLNKVPELDHVQLRKRSSCWGLRDIFWLPNLTSATEAVALGRGTQLDRHTFQTCKCVAPGVVPMRDEGGGNLYRHTLSDVPVSDAWRCAGE